MKILHNRSPRIGTTLREVYHSLYFAPSVVFVAILFITYWSWRASLATVSRDTDSVIVDRTLRIQNELTQRLASYEQILTGGAGLVRGSQDVTKDEWHDYVSTFNVSIRYPGLQSIGYIKTFTADQLATVTSQMQAQGIDFHLLPDNPRDFYTAVIYSDPERTINTAGLDMFVEPHRKKTMIKARDTGQTSITPPLKPLLPDTQQDVIYMYVPQYKSGELLDTIDQRQQALQGYIYARLLSQDFFSTIGKTEAIDNHVAFQLSGLGSNDSWLTFYKTPNYDHFSSDRGYVDKIETISMYGQTWTINYSFKISELLPIQRRNAPAWTILAGMLFAFLLAEVIYLLLKARANELSNLKEEAVDLAKDELLSLASHQLRTPATTVKQYLGMVLQGFAGDITPTQASLLDKAYAGNERQLYIINEMLHVAKIDAGRIVLARHPTDINKLLNDIIKEAEPDSTALNHTIVCKLPKKPLIMNVDEHMLRMSIENLISNAIKYTLPGGTIKVTVSKLETTAKIYVKDTGIGIDQKDIAKLYKLFTRLDNPLTQNVSGTGVGLYLAKHLIELHGGSLSVVSKLKEGSTFIVTLPLTAK